MKTDSRKWLECLELYGSDFGRWPEKPSAGKQKIIKALPEYSEASETDMILSGIEWPTMREDVFLNIMSSTESVEGQKSKANCPSPIILSFFRGEADIHVPRQLAFFASLFFLFMLIGISSGTKMNRKVQEYGNYAYFSIGPAYALGETIGGSDV